MAKQEIDLDAMTADKRREYKKRLDAMRLTAIEKLKRDYGRRMVSRTCLNDVFEAICAVTKRRQGFRTDLEYLDMFLTHVAGRQASSREPQPFKALTLSPATRVAFDRAGQHQCSLYTPKGIGNGQERTHGFGRGQ